MLEFGSISLIFCPVFVVAVDGQKQELEMVSRRPNLFFAIAAAMLLGVVSNVEAGLLFSSLKHTVLVTAQLADASNSTLKG